MRRLYIVGFGVLLLICILVLGISTFNNSNRMINKDESNIPVIKYVAIGDSYTIGNGVKTEERWPNLMTKHLNEAGVGVTLVGNPAVSGYTVQDAINYEIPKLRQLNPDFVTLLIGANDSFGGGDVLRFKSDLIKLIDQIQDNLVTKENLVLVTVPDFTMSPATRDYGDLAKERSRLLIQQYNQVIKELGTERGLRVADIFPVSQTMTGEEDYIYDGLHPSGLGYQKWEKVIYPEALELLK